MHNKQFVSVVTVGSVRCGSHAPPNAESGSPSVVTNHTQTAERAALNQKMWDL